MYFPTNSLDLSSNKEKNSFEQGIADRMFARLIGSSTISFQQASSCQLSAFTKYLNPEYQHPSRQTLVEHIYSEANEAMKLLKKILDDSPMANFFYIFFVVKNCFLDSHINRHLDSA